MNETPLELKKLRKDYKILEAKHKELLNKYEAQNLILKSLCDLVDNHNCTEFYHNLRKEERINIGVI